MTRADLESFTATQVQACAESLVVFGEVSFFLGVLVGLFFVPAFFAAADRVFYLMQGQGSREQ
jgi:hypothetical protein